ncbi:zinc dependent phospholipase C family protein [Wukongibacter sp. M2B1]|uniref:zinc dependent phospholipase C family protein n=1 Tax=Wukongibacter sp. M2B1 TaxID=3088895 RepID=UPI003D7B7431
MLVGTHLLIGENVYKYIKKNLNMELDKKRFLYGNIKPDVVFRLSSRSHRIKDSLGFVLEEIERLIRAKNISLDQFSVDLGVISHFVSDFFCSPHFYERPEYDDIVKHLYYELSLHNRFRKIVQANNEDFFQEEINNFKNKTYLEIIHLLKESYIKNMISIKNDISHALRASKVITKKIIEDSMFYKQKRIAA